MKQLPVGISTLSAIREADMVYIDKTELAFHMARQPARYFLSRPRRFGKSLLVDTFKEIFEGNEPLFRGLHIHDKWDWSRRHPVVKFDFAGGELTDRPSLELKIAGLLEDNANRLGVKADLDSGVPVCFSRLLRDVETAFGRKVVVLVDEYDKPILDNIEDPATAADMRSGLKNLYSVLKEEDARLQFIFMTGVSKFSKVSLFSGLNQLEDITIHPGYSNICGYTPADVENHFAEHLEGVDREQLRRWYNGYNWTGEDRVYNPYDILLFIRQARRFHNYWFETGNPSFLIRLFREKRIFLPDLECIETGEDVLFSFDVENINPLTLLFQSGYLTIESLDFDFGEPNFRLRTPNQEVRQSLSLLLAKGYTHLQNEPHAFRKELMASLASGRIDDLAGVITRLFAAIPWRNFTNNDLADFEGYYASVLYAFFASLNAQVIPEDITNKGQADLTVILENRIVVMEIKVTDETEIEGNPALEQIRKRGYAEKYRGRPGAMVHELGLVFSRKTRNLIQADGG